LAVADCCTRLEIVETFPPLCVYIAPDGEGVAMDDWTDEALMVLFQQGNSAAFERLPSFNQSLPVGSCSIKNQRGLCLCAARKDWPPSSGSQQPPCLRGSVVNSLRFRVLPLRHRVTEGESQTPNAGRLVTKRANPARRVMGATAEITGIAALPMKSQSPTLIQNEPLKVIPGWGPDYAVAAGAGTQPCILCVTLVLSFLNSA